MRTPQQVVDALVHLGAEIRELGAGRATVVGDVPADLIEDLRAQREEVIDAWRAMRCDRWLKAPPETLPLRRAPVTLGARDRGVVQKYVLGQPGEVSRWALLRAEQYRSTCPKWSDSACATAACMDVLAWQMHRHPDPVSVVTGLHEAAEEFLKTQTTKP